MLSFGSFIGLAKGSPFKFAIIYSFGNVIALIGYIFIINPKKYLMVKSLR
jgi:hypothetical protein